MYPQINIFDSVTIYTFGLSLSIGFILFFFMLYKLSGKFGINTNFFLGNGFVFLLSTFIFSKGLYILTHWDSFIVPNSWNTLLYLLTSNYQFSLVGGIIGFVSVLAYKIIRYHLPSEKYIDAVVLSFFFAAIVVYIGAFLGGQISGKPTTLPIGIAYTNSESISSYTSPVVPLALFYSFFSFILFTVLYILRMSFIHKEWFVGYVGIAVFSMILLIFDFFSSDTDIIGDLLYLNLTQIFSLFLLGFSIRWMKKIFQEIH